MKLPTKTGTKKSFLTRQIVENPHKPDSRHKFLALTTNLVHRKKFYMKFTCNSCKKTFSYSSQKKICALCSVGLSHNEKPMTQQTYKIKPIVSYLALTSNKLNHI